jgi:hypothetical protein
VTQRWIGKRALLVQGLEAIYGNSNKFIPYHEALKHTFVAGTDASKPKSFCKAMQHPDANLWYKATVKEMQAHIENSTVGHVCHGQLRVSCGASRACVISASI